MSARQPHSGLQVVIAGGGVAALEAALALRQLAGDLVQTTLVSPTDRFTFVPASVGAPFGRSVIRQFDLLRIAGDAGARFVRASAAGVDPERRLLHLQNETSLPYQALLVACGTTAHEAVPGAITFGGPGDVEQIRDLVDEAAAGDASRLLFAIPSNVGWTLPLYELCLLTCDHLIERTGPPVEIGLVTPEASPLSAFGGEASRLVRSLLDDRNIAFHGARTAVKFEHGRLRTRPVGTLEADRVVALPRLRGAAIEGLPVNGDGFIRTDEHGRIDDLVDVYAAGDITAFPVKQGGIAAQQAVAAAQTIAADAGADVTPQPFAPVLRGLLMTGAEERFLRADVRGGRGETSTTTEQPLWWPPGKLAAHYLTPYLADLDAQRAFAG